MRSVSGMLGGSMKKKTIKICKAYDRTGRSKIGALGAESDKLVLTSFLSLKDETEIIQINH